MMDQAPLYLPSHVYGKAPFLHRFATDFHSAVPFLEAASIHKITPLRRLLGPERVQVGEEIESHGSCHQERCLFSSGNPVRVLDLCSGNSTAGDAVSCRTDMLPASGPMCSVKRARHGRSRGRDSIGPQNLVRRRWRGKVWVRTISAPLRSQAKALQILAREVVQE